MMKKKLIALLAFVLVLGSLTACGKDAPRGESTDSTVKNGTYDAQWADFDSRGWKDYLVLRIDGTTREVLEFDARNADGELLSANSEAADAMKEAHAAARLPVMTPKQAHQAAIDSFRAADGNPEDMELVAGATESCLSLQSMVQQVLATSALTGEKEACKLPLYLGGSYTVSADSTDSEGWALKMTLTAGGSGITIDQFDAVNKEGALRSAQDSDFAALCTALLESYPTGQASCEDADLTRSFQLLLNRATENARFSGPNEDTVSLLANGEYRAEMADSQNGWKDYLVLVASNGRISVKEFDGVNEAGERKSTNTTWGEQGRDAKAYTNQIVTAFQAANQNPLTMENVAGATLSTNNFRLMAGELLGYSLPTGDDTPLMVQDAQASSTPSAEEEKQPEESSDSSAQ